MSRVILAVGEAIAEFMRTRRGVPLDRTGEMVGPFPSGAPPIVASVAARLSVRSALCAVVGEDPFGRLIRQRLQEDGVEVSQVRSEGAASTACAFVAYENSGDREFVFHVAGSAANRLGEDDLGDLPEQASWLHLSGSTVALGDRLAAVAERAAERVLAAGGRLSLDPNVRPEAVRPEVITRIRRLAASAELLLPSEGELAALGLSEDIAPVLCTTLGARGAEVVWQGRRELVPAPQAVERDPTGAGDTFAAAFLASTLHGADPVEAARTAVGIAAAAVERLGPMEAPVSARSLNR